MKNSDNYRSYLLQLWRVENDSGGWRARLKDVETGERLGFASLDKLVAFLLKLGADEPAADQQAAQEEPSAPKPCS